MSSQSRLVAAPWWSLEVNLLMSRTQSHDALPHYPQDDCASPRQGSDFRRLVLPGYLPIVRRSSSLLNLSPILLFGLTRGHSSASTPFFRLDGRPATPSRTVAVRACRFFSGNRRLGLDGREHVGMLERDGTLIVRELRATCLYSESERSRITIPNKGRKLLASKAR